MTKTRIIGDVHGHKYELSLILDNLPEDVTSVIQVGDMGVGFGQGDYWHESLDELMLSKNAGFIRGNHDDPARCKTMKSWIPDGTVTKDMMLIGGAWSIDQAWRTEGVDWWADEELSYGELLELTEVYDKVRPKLMITHDCPLSVSKKLFIDTGKSMGNHVFNTRTGAALEAMFDLHIPKLWIMGHWHHNVDEVIEGTRFICVGIMSYVDIDLKTMEVTKPTYFG